MANEEKGMYRRVDILGRVVIPREVRKSLRINYGDLMEFVVKDNKQVVMQKYELLDDFLPLLVSVIELAKLNNSVNIIITDKEKILCYNNQIIQESTLSSEFIKILNARKDEKMTNLKLNKEVVLQGECIVMPILSQGDVLGGVVLQNASITGTHKSIGEQIVNIISNYFSN